MTSIEQEARNAAAVPSPPWDDGPRAGRTLTPGILEAHGYANDRADRLEHVLEANLIDAVNALEEKLRPLLRQTPSPDTVPGPTSPTSSGPSTGTSSVVAQLIGTVAHRLDTAADRVDGITIRIRTLTDTLDLA